jgi:hypothetical protein
MARRLTSLVVIISLLGAWAVLPIRSAEAQPAEPAEAQLTGIPVTGKAKGTIQGAFNGLLALQKFVEEEGQLMAEGTLTIAKQGQVVSLPVRLPVTQIQVQKGEEGEGITTQQATCDILNLELGPIDLNLLGLEIHTNRIRVDIIANPAGGLLGQLLCGLAGLLDGPATNLEQIVDLLNQILDLLG